MEFEQKTVIAISEFKNTMEQTIWGPEVYFVFSVINFVEMFGGIILGWYGIWYSQNPMSFFGGIVGFVGQVSAAPSIILSSVWIWVNHPHGVYEQEKITK